MVVQKGPLVLCRKKTCSVRTNLSSKLLMLEIIVFIYGSFPFQCRYIWGLLIRAISAHIIELPHTSNHYCL